jgi:hypothetical protein
LNQNGLFLLQGLKRFKKGLKRAEQIKTYFHFPRGPDRAGTETGNRIENWTQKVGYESVRFLSGIAPPKGASQGGLDANLGLNRTSTEPQPDLNRTSTGSQPELVNRAGNQTLITGLWELEPQPKLE